MIALRRTVATAAHAARDLWNGARVAGAPKVFCVGFNKTGTTSLAVALRELGFVVGHQRRAEQLADRCYPHDLAPLLRYCRTAQAFQDAPFSWPDTFRALDAAFPGARFVHSVRDDPDQWARSLHRAHARDFGRDGRPPTADALRAVPYVRPGFLARMLRAFGAPDDDPYQVEALRRGYERHRDAVRAHFAARPDDLLVVNVARAEDYRRFTDFLGVRPARAAFPWENRT